MAFALERLASLASLFDRARHCVRDDQSSLARMLDEADGALRTIDATLTRAETERDRDAIRRALAHAQESHASLTEAIHQEADRLARELSLLSAGAGATAHYGAAASAGVAPGRPRLHRTA